MIAAVPILCRRTHQPEPGFVNQRGGLKGVTRCLLGHFRRRQSAQFFIDQRQQFIGGLAIALLHAFENLGEIAHARQSLPSQTSAANSKSMGDDAPPYNWRIALSRAAKSWPIVASVSSPMFEMRKVVPLILP